MFSLPLIYTFKISSTDKGYLSTAKRQGPNRVHLVRPNHEKLVAGQPCDFLLCNSSTALTT